MSLRIFTPEPLAPAPRIVRMELTCDGTEHGMFPSAPFTSNLGYPNARSAAIRAGWKITPGGLVLGLYCSGKAADEEWRGAL